MLTKHTENLSPPTGMTYTHIRFLKTAVKMRTPLFAGPGVDQNSQGLLPHTEHGVTGRQDGRVGVASRTPDGQGARLSWPSLWYGVYTSPQFIPTTLRARFLLWICSLHQLNILGETLYNQIVKFELPKLCNIQHLGSRLGAHLPAPPPPSSTAWDRPADQVLALRLVSGWHFSKKASSVLTFKVWISHWNVFLMDH